MTTPNTLTINAWAVLQQGPSQQPPQVNWMPGATTLSQTNVGWGEFTQLVPTTGPVLLNFPAGLGTVGYMLISNLDTNTGNYVYLYSTTGGVSFGAVRPGGYALFELGPGAQAPAINALSTALNVQVLVFTL